MLLAAVEIEDPVIFCEHKFLYYHLKAELASGSKLAGGQGSHRTARPHATIVTLQRHGHESLRAARNCSKTVIKSEWWICAA